MRSAAPEPRPVTTVLTWDWPHRLWHWAFAGCIGVSLYTGLTASGDVMNVHIASGITVIALLLFRLGWAIWGSRYVRIGQYRMSATAVWQHLRGRPRRNLVHSAPAAAMALTMFGVILVQAVSGLFSSDDILTDGPFVRLVSSRSVDIATAIHTRVFWVVFALIGVHIGALGWYAARHDPIALSMLHGRQQVELPAITGHRWSHAAATMLGAAMLIWLAARLI
jgi:cytochrome b